jgi:hypothetical protein
MKTCERLVKAGYFISNQPARLLAHGFREMQVMVTILVNAGNGHHFGLIGIQI